MRDNDGKQKSVAAVLAVHSKWKRLLDSLDLTSKVFVFSDVSSVPKGARVIPPSPRARDYFLSLGYDVACNGESESEVEEFLSKATVAPKEKTLLKFTKQSQVVEFLEQFMYEHGFFVFSGRVIHVTPKGVREVTKDYLAREVLRYYDILFSGKDYIPTERLCGLALAGASLREIDVVRKYPLFLSNPNPRVFCPKANLKTFTSKYGDVVQSVERYFAVLGLPFKDMDSISSTLAAMLTPLVYCPCSPIWVITSSTPGVGKTLLAQSVYALATGEVIPVTPYPESDSEARKQITSALLNGKPSLIWDNLSRPLGGSSIDAVTTARSWKDRILGKSVMVEIPKFISIACTGNNVTLTADTYRRVIVTHLKSSQEGPEKKYFDRDLIEECVGLHREFVDDALSWLAFYERQGYTPSRGFGSFEQWNRVVGGFVEWLLGVHPASTAETISSEDQEILERVLDSFPYSEPTTVDVMASDSESTIFGTTNKAFVSALREISHNLNPKEILRWFRHREGLVCKGRFICSKKTSTGRAFYVCKVQS